MSSRTKLHVQVKNQSYKENLLKLRNLVLVLFDADTIVQPRESEWFGYFKPGSDKEMITLQNSTLYKEVCAKLCYILLLGLLCYMYELDYVGSNRIGLV